MGLPIEIPPDDWVLLRPADYGGCRFQVKGTQTVLIELSINKPIHPDMGHEFQPSMIDYDMPTDDPLLALWVRPLIPGANAYIRTMG